MTQDSAQGIAVVTYDPAWPGLYAGERDRILEAAAGRIVEIEHVGSTAVPGLRAKPIIDVMAAVADLEVAARLAADLEVLGYRMVETGMRGRLFLTRQDLAGGQSYHLHLVERSGWETRKERLMRDELLSDPQAVRAYGELKTQLALLHAHDGLAYTRAKTAFVQSLVDRARAARGLPRVDVWEAD
ncbi:GrpB-like predicted nucleotidyltransferase (UPF0157 family) [Deinobacterium chartae]|uniref:GrpB-like predicted nucleotidyltransferase (UPF0157 family) n=1 Tax=Deinobacterium chartae TaxID=521158 RepID=A0A841HZ92_9DEIO|nr:GrpB family protein [Deinobacterium chartae]MBB6098717.1 GrpB-like predicted nucleotidyltransferase (UPF0157 family) [Deinobacterium chartae]